MGKLFIALAVAAAATCAQAQYSGAELRTKDAYVYGRFEVRMRSAAGNGLVSSFFTYSDASYPTWNEIDLEILGRYPDENQFNQITGQAGSEVNHVRRYAAGFNPHEGFHTYVFEWYPDSVVYYVDGLRAHRALTDVKLLKYPQKIMMNIWISTFTDWVGPFSPSILPAYAFYDYVSYSAYTPKAGPGGSDFTLSWRDDFNEWNAARWEKGSHGFENNMALFVPANVALQGGLAILCLTQPGQEGFHGKIPAAIARPAPGAAAASMLPLSEWRVDGRWRKTAARR
jgi:beta-glucanase (GH16 family)